MKPGRKGANLRPCIKLISAGNHQDLGGACTRQGGGPGDNYELLSSYVQGRLHRHELPQTSGPGVAEQVLKDSGFAATEKPQGDRGSRRAPKCKRFSSHGCCEQPVLITYSKQKKQWAERMRGDIGEG